MSAKGDFTNAWLLRQLSKMSRDLAGHVESLAEGAWNPNFCAEDATVYALSILPEIKARIEWIERRLPTPTPTAAEATTDK